MAGLLILRDGRDPSDVKLLQDTVDRVGKAFRMLRRDGIVAGQRDQLSLMRWHLVK